MYEKYICTYVNILIEAKTKEVTNNVFYDMSLSDRHKILSKVKDT